MFILSEDLKNGNRTGVDSLQSLQAYSCPHFKSAFFSKSGTPDTLLISRQTKIGPIRVTYCPPLRLEAAKMVAPVQRVISPTQLGCLEYFHNPILMNRSLLSGLSLKLVFCSSEMISTARPVIQMPIPMNSSKLKVVDAKDLVVMTAKRGPIVMMTQSPCINQAQKNLILVFLISMNLLSMLVLLILKNKNEPSLPAHINTINPATVCFKLICSLVSEAMKVMEMKVMLPVKSQYFSVLQIMAGIDAITCTSKEQAVRKQMIGTEQTSLDWPERQYAKSEERESTTVGVMSFFIEINMIRSLIEILQIYSSDIMKRQIYIYIIGLSTRQSLL